MTTNLVSRPAAERSPTELRAYGDVAADDEDADAAAVGGDGDCDGHDDRSLHHCNRPVIVRADR